MSNLKLLTGNQTWQRQDTIHGDWPWASHDFWMGHHTVNMVETDLKIVIWSVSVRSFSIFTGRPSWNYKYGQTFNAAHKCPRACESPQYVTFSKDIGNVAGQTFKVGS